MAFLREKNHCDGCRLPDRKCSASCTMASCTERRGNYCSSCASYPCKKVKHIDKRYRTRYGMSMIENLDEIKRSGIRKFVAHQKERWTCACGGTINIHRKMCSICGKKR